MDSQTDALTGVGNRKMFDQSIATLEQNVQLDAPFSLLMGDVDFFKKFNDAYGHQIGDQVLRLVATAMKASVKGGDIVARYGGEEFAVLLPNTRLDQAMRVAEQIRLAVMSKELVKRSTGERLGRITISFGCSMWSAGDTSGAMIERADAALYAAKRAGRNQVMSQDASGMMMPMAA
jgi:diguanylate cyclase